MEADNMSSFQNYDELKSSRFTTGVPRLDTILMGGLIPSDMYIIYGAPGTGKSVLCNQICFHQIHVHKSKCIYLTLISESPADIITHFKNFSFFDENFIPESLILTSGYALIKKDGVSSLLPYLKNAIMKQEAKVLIFEGIEQTFDLTKNKEEFIDFINGLGQLARMTNCTVIMTSYSNSLYLGFGLVDGIIELTNTQIGMRQIRELTIHKFRGSDFLGGSHRVEIKTEGLVCHPRLEVRHSVPVTLPTYEHRRLSMGNADLDRIMHGGIFSESSMVILGELGSGKTTLGLSFLAEGARIGQQCIYMGFSETPEQVISRAESLGIPLTKYMDENLMHIMWQPPVELLLDTLSERLLDFLKEKHIIQSRIFIDGIEGFSIATAYRERLPLFTSALLNQLRNAGATTLISRGLTITAGSGEVGGNTLMDNMCDSVIRLRYIRYQERFYRFFNVVKMRESDYDPVSVPFAIGNGGFVLGEMSEEHKMALRTAPVEF